MEKLAQLLNYCATHPDASVRFTASDMLLAVESDASYLSVAKGRSRAAGYFYLTNHQAMPSSSTFKPNGAVHVLCHIMRKVLSSAAEAKLGALFHNGKEACPLRIALAEMGHPQPATPMATDNNTASGIVTHTVKQKRSKAIDMRFYWIRDRVRQGQFQIYWRKGARKRADNFSKIVPRPTTKPSVPLTCTPLQTLRATTSNVSPTPRLLRVNPQPLCALLVAPSWPLVRV